MHYSQVLRNIKSPSSSSHLHESITNFLSTLRKHREFILEHPQLNRLKLNHDMNNNNTMTSNSSSIFTDKDSQVRVIDTSIVASRREYVENLIPKPTPLEFFPTMLREPKYYSELIDLKVIDQFCVFCNREIVSEGLIEESENFMALYNIRPVFPGHSLIIPKKHVTRFSSLPLEHAKEFVEFSQLVIRALKQIHNTDSIELLIQEGPLSGQSICHLHLHLMPRIPNDMPNPDDDWMEFFSRNEHSARLLTKEERQEYAKHVRQVMKSL